MDNLRKMANNASSPETRRALIKAADMVDKVNTLIADVAAIKKFGTRVAPQWPGRATVSEPSEICRLLERLNGATSP